MPEEKGSYNAQPGSYGPELPTVKCNLCSQPVIERQAMFIGEFDGEKVYKHWDVYKCNAALQHALRVMQAEFGERAGECRWSYQGYAWASECGNYYSFDGVDSPSRDGMKFCPYCGRKLVEVQDGIHR